MIMHDVLVHGTNPDKAVNKVIRRNDKIISEFTAGIDSLSRKDRKELTRSLRNMLGN